MVTLNETQRKDSRDKHHSHLQIGLKYFQTQIQICSTWNEVGLSTLNQRQPQLCTHKLLKWHMKHLFSVVAFYIRRLKCIWKCYFIVKASAHFALWIKYTNYLSFIAQGKSEKAKLWNVWWKLRNCSLWNAPQFRLLSILSLISSILTQKKHCMCVCVCYGASRPKRSWQAMCQSSS